MHLFPLMVLIFQLASRFSESRPMDRGFGAESYEAARYGSRAPRAQSGKPDGASPRRNLYIAYHSAQTDWSDEIKQRVCDEMREITARAMNEGGDPERVLDFASNVVRSRLQQDGVEINLEDVIKIWNKFLSS